MIRTCTAFDGALTGEADMTPTALAKQAKAQGLTRAQALAALIADGVEYPDAHWAVTVAWRKR